MEGKASAGVVCGSVIISSNMNKVSLFNISSVISPCFFSIRPSPRGLLLHPLTGLPLALRVVTQAYGLFLHLSFELLTPQLRGVKWYC